MNQSLQNSLLLNEYGKGSQKYIYALEYSITASEPIFTKLKFFLKLFVKIS
jgi:hypothetical protein